MYLNYEGSFDSIWFGQWGSVLEFVGTHPVFSVESIRPQGTRIFRCIFRSDSEYQVLLLWEVVLCESWLPPCWFRRVTLWWEYFALADVGFPLISVSVKQSVRGILLARHLLTTLLAVPWTRKIVGLITFFWGWTVGTKVFDRTSPPRAELKL